VGKKFPRLWNWFSLGRSLWNDLTEKRDKL
jgi:hypothetical protein